MKMRKTAGWAVLGAAALIASASNCTAKGAVGTQTTQISFDGYCDGMKITVFPWHQAGVVQGGCGGASFGAGMEGKVKGISPKDLTIGENYPGTYGFVLLWNIQYPLATGNTWSLYSTTDGVNLTYQNSGTYTVLDAAAQFPQMGPPSDNPAWNKLAALGPAAPIAGASHAGGGAQTTKISYGSGDGSVMAITVFPSHQAVMSDNDAGIPGIGVGMEGKVTGVSPKDLTMEENYADFPDTTYLWNIQYPLANGNAWSIYTTADGVNFSYVNSGTYTIVGSEARSSGAGPSVHNNSVRK